MANTSSNTNNVVQLPSSDLDAMTDEQLQKVDVYESLTTIAETVTTGRQFSSGELRLMKIHYDTDCLARKLKSEQAEPTEEFFIYVDSWGREVRFRGLTAAGKQQLKKELFEISLLRLPTGELIEDVAGYTEPQGEGWTFYHDQKHSSHWRRWHDAAAHADNDNWGDEQWKRLFPSRPQLIRKRTPDGREFAEMHLSTKAVAAKTAKPDGWVFCGEEDGQRVYRQWHYSDGSLTELASPNLGWVSQVVER